MNEKIDSTHITIKKIEFYFNENRVSSESGLINRMKSRRFFQLINELSKEYPSNDFYVAIPIFLKSQEVTHVLSINAKRAEIVRPKGIIEKPDEVNFKKLYSIKFPISKFGYQYLGLYQPPGNKLLAIAEFLFSANTYQGTFKTLVADWQEEHFKALDKKEIWKARWINVRYTYAFLAAMWMKSPIGDLIQFVIKIAKQ